MGLHIIQIDKHKFVCGLFWQSLSRPRELRKEAGDLAKKIDCDLMVLRMDHAMAQAGFAHSRDGARRGMLSLAAIASKTVAIEGAVFDGKKQRAHNWLGAFKLPDGMWAYLAVRDANFLPNGDFAGSREEVLERLHSDYGLGGWNVVIGDRELEQYGFHNFNPRALEDLVPRTRAGKIRLHRWWALRPLRTQVPWPQLAGAVAALAVAGVAGASMWQKTAQQKSVVERGRLVAARGAASPPVAPRPWASQPEPLQVARACLSHFSHLTAGGWRLEEYACTPDSASYAWSRQSSTVGLLLAQVPEATIDLGGEKATFSKRLARGAGRDEALPEQRQLVGPLTSKLQALRLVPKLAKVPVPPAPPARGGKPAAPPPKPEWQAYSYSVAAGGIAPAELAAVLNRDGVRIGKMIYRGGKWSIEGVMYAK
jgi:hypothetical protein